ncbi:nucleotide-diphospho-sugar transferase, partial [Peziza echinospora]
MGITVPTSVADCVSLGRAACEFALENPAVIVTLVLGLLIAVAASGYLLLLLVAHYPRPELPSEKLYLTILPSGETSAPLPLPSTTDYLPTTTTDKPTPPTDPLNPPVLISVIVPAYNESLRLPLMLSDAVTFLTTAFPPPPTSSTTTTPYGWEILIIDDGSTDSTSLTALTWARKNNHTNTPHSSIRTITLARNRGKGGAVTHGMRHLRGQHAIFADADGATKFADLTALLESLSTSSSDIAVGSRAHMLTTPAVVQRSKIRNLLMYTFHTYLSLMMAPLADIKDTQCGFKLFTRRAAAEIFPRMHNEGWIFDVEVLLLAKKLGYGIREVPVTWHEVEGTKMSLVRDSVMMAWDLAVLRGGYGVGMYGTGTG